MARAKIVRDMAGLLYGISIKCPGCEHGSHLLPVSWLPDGETEESPHAEGKPHWTFNGNMDRPTFGPSIKSTGLHNTTERVCHSLVHDGRIEFLGDCTHALAGHTVDLPEVEE